MHSGYFLMFYLPMLLCGQDIILLTPTECLTYPNEGVFFSFQARRSMEFAPHLTSLGDAFRRDVLNSTDLGDRTVPPPSWLHQPWPLSPALGGMYVCFHWRRGDFPHSPSPQTAARQALQAIQRSEALLQLESDDQPLNIYLATDAELEGSWS